MSEGFNYVLILKIKLPDRFLSKTTEAMHVRKVTIRLVTIGFLRPNLSRRVQNVYKLKHVECRDRI